MHKPPAKWGSSSAGLVKIVGNPSLFEGMLRGRVLHSNYSVPGLQVPVSPFGVSPPEEAQRFSALSRETGRRKIPPQKKLAGGIPAGGAAQDTRQLEAVRLGLLLVHRLRPGASTIHQLCQKLAGTKPPEQLGRCPSAAEK